MFRPNVGTFDRDIRLVLAAFFGLLALFGPFPGLWQLVPAFLTLLMLVTAATAFCPSYKLFGINTCEDKPKPVRSDRV